MYRWPIDMLTGVSQRGAVQRERCLVEVSPRGLTFTLSMLAGVGHPTHLALIDAYLKGEVRMPRHGGLGCDSRLTLSRLIGPLVLAHERGVTELGLGDVILLPTGGPTGGVPTPERSYSMVLAPTPTYTVTTTEAPYGSGPPGSDTVDRPSWVEVDVEIPCVSTLEQRLADAGPPAPIDARAVIAGHAPHSLVRDAPSGPLTPLDGAVTPAMLAALKRQAHDQAAKVPPVLPSALDTLVHVVEHDRPDQLAAALGVAVQNRHSATGRLEHDGLTLGVALAPEADGGATLALLPPVEAEPIPNLVGRMEAAARAVLRGLMGVPFAEERKEAIEHRLIGPERTTTLLVGWSLVLTRNRRVFAAWLGSDGRVLIRLFPPEGQRARGRS